MLHLTRRADGAGDACDRGDPVDRRHRGHLLQVASEYGGLKSDQVKRLKDLETENTRLRKAISDLTLDKLILQELPRETSKPRTPPCLH